MQGDANPSVALGLTATWVDPQSAVLAVAGEIDIANADSLAAAVSSILAVARTRRLVLDLAEVRFLDARGVAVLISAFRQGTVREVAVVVINCQPLTMRILEITGVGKLLTGDGYPHQRGGGGASPTRSSRSR